LTLNGGFDGAAAAAASPASRAKPATAKRESDLCNVAPPWFRWDSPSLVRAACRNLEIALIGCLSGGVEFAILGAVEARDNGRPLTLGGGKQRALFAFLLLHANEVVSRDRIIDAVWGERPPPSVQQSLDSYVSRLRRVLGAERLVRRAHGYVFVTEP